MCVIGVKKLKTESYVITGEWNELYLKDGKGLKSGECVTVS